MCRPYFGSAFPHNHGIDYIIIILHNYDTKWNVIRDVMFIILRMPLYMHVILFDCSYVRSEKSKLMCIYVLQ